MMNQVILLTWIAVAAVAQTLVPAEIKVSSATVPAGGTVQMQFSLTEPKPIMTGTQGASFDGSVFDAVFGIAAFSPAGDAFGTARYSAGALQVNLLSPLGSYGTILDYPMLTIAAHISNSALAGRTTQVTLDPGSGYTDATGVTNTFVVNKPGIEKVGGSISINNIVPGGGTWPAGTLVRVIGQGFSRSTKVSTKMRTSFVAVVSSTEIDLILQRAQTLDAQLITVQNPDGSSANYYSYLRAIEDGATIYPSVGSVTAIFPTLAYTKAAVVQSGPDINGSVKTALAMENSSPSAAIITVEASGPGADGLSRQTFVLASGHKLTREIGEFFGTTLAPGTPVKVSSTVPLKFVAFTVSSTGVATPFLAQLSN